MFLALVIGMGLSIPTRAENLARDLEVEQIVGEEADRFIESFGLKPLSAEDTHQSIVSFDVSEDGTVVLGLDGNIIQILDQQGTVIASYGFHCDGSYFVLAQGNRFGIYCCRGENIIWFDDTGICSGVYRVLPTEENNTVISSRLHTATAERNDIRYQLERDIRLDERKYSRLTATDGSGHKSILYDVTLDHNIRVILGYCAIALFVTVCAFSMIQQSKRKTQTD